MLTAVLTFLITTWVFYTLLSIGAIVIITCHEKNENGWAHTIFVALTALAVYKFTPNFTSGDLITYLSLYFVVGIIWSFLKWFFFLKEVKNKYNTTRDEYSKIKDTNSPNFLENLRQYINEKMYKYSYDFNISYDGKMTYPQASENKARITTWIAHWPLSMIWTLINDPVRKVLNYIFNQFKGIYQKMSNYIFGSIKEDFVNIKK